jgi:hypothetical protein
LERADERAKALAEEEGNDNSDVTASAGDIVAVLVEEAASLSHRLAELEAKGADPRG